MAKGFGKVGVRALSETREAKVLRRSVLKHFSQLLDPRVERTRQHGLLEIISIAILAVLCGADSFVAIEAYGLALQSWLESFLDLPHGIPSHDRFGRVFGMLDPQELGACFLAWVESLVEKLDIELIHLDGKTARGSYDREGKLKALHSVSAGPSEHGLMLARAASGQPIE